MSGRNAGGGVPTIADVAREARVSRATVSRVLNDNPHTRPLARAAVLQAVRKLAYRPDHVARSLARRETQTLGLIVANIANPFYAETARVIVETAREAGYNVILCDTDNQATRHEGYVEILRQRRVDGIIFGSVFLRDPVVEQLIDNGFPCMMYNRRLRSGRGNYVVLDNFKAGREVTCHLLALGHRRVGFIAGLRELPTAADRFRGYRASLQEAGIRVDPNVIRPDAFGADMTRQAVTGLIKLHKRPTAIVAGNDMLALTVMRAAAELGVRVPEDLAVVGFDDIEMASHPSIQLTTVAQDEAEMARVAVGGLLETIREPERFRREPLRKVVVPTLKVRRTCGAGLQGLDVHKT